MLKPTIALINSHLLNTHSAAFEDDGLALYLSLLLSLLKLANSLLLLIGPEIKVMKEEARKFMVYYRTILSLSERHLSFFPTSSSLVLGFAKERLKFIQSFAIFHFDFLREELPSIRSFIMDNLAGDLCLEDTIACLTVMKNAEERDSFEFELAIVDAVDRSARGGTEREGGVMQRREASINEH